ncbi:hypothetical protein OSB04_002182 [Centaurea solstitialis]|uniref:Uncharacterized protein n=1 Tax=Centaurea solstitialis TaxID=347529 RepID=A0AA38U308_9ASTR|nr:hypothetical protein OSB04_002182 [Centaurea solstitialis]
MWHVRGRDDKFHPNEVCELYPTLMSMKIHHGGVFTKGHERKYLNDVYTEHSETNLDTYSKSPHAYDVKMHELPYERGSNIGIGKCKKNLLLEWPSNSGEGGGSGQRWQETETPMTDDFDHFFEGMDMGLGEGMYVEESENNEGSMWVDENNIMEVPLVDEGNIIDDIEFDMTNIEEFDMTNLEAFDSASDSDFKSTRKKNTIAPNPEVPILAIQEHLERKYSVNVSVLKSFRAKAMALKKIGEIMPNNMGPFPGQILIAFMDHLWKCLAASNIQMFNKAIDDFRKFNDAAHKWLKEIPPKHWLKAYLTSRCHSDLLVNNICEVFNGQVVNGQDKPIIMALEFIRQYLMKRIVNVQKVIAKCVGPLTPAATYLFNTIKKQVVLYRVLGVNRDAMKACGGHNMVYGLK